MGRKQAKGLLPALLLAAALTAAAGSGALSRPDNALADALYQRPVPLSGDIVVVGIDQRSLEALGPLPWSREIMARAIGALNADASARPAVIGVDVLYVGESDPDADAALVEAAAEGGNVVVAGAAQFGAELVAHGGSFYMDDYAVQAYDRPFPALAAVAGQGHINAMYDPDGILRHALLTVPLPEGGTEDSFAWVLAQAYARASGLPAPARPETDGRGRYYLSYSGAPGAYYDGVSVIDLLDGSVTGADLAGQLVLIGPYAAGLSDYVTAAVDHSRLMYGVEVQANAAEAILSGRYKTEAAEFPQLLFLFAACLLCLLWFQGRGMLPATLAWVGVSGGSLMLSLALFDRGVVVHPLWVPLAVSVLYIGSVAANYARAALEKRRVTNTFKRYVAPEIVGEILREGTDALGLGGKLTDIAVLFVDIRGFTTMSEVLTPPQVVEILNRYLSLTTDCVMRNHGTLDKFVGDCTMAIWNAPLPQEDYVYLAAKAAVDMVEGSRALTQELQAQFGRTVSFGVGIHCGSAVVGNIGAEMRMDFTAIGDTVNTAARLEANAPAGKIYISRAVADALAGRVQTTSLGDSVPLKGKAAGFEVLTLDGLLPEQKGKAAVYG